jgi:dynein heavy chain 1, cytosolic
VLFDAVLDHVLRIDRVFRQPQGHLLLIGISGSGKTTLSRFVAWLNGMCVYQIKAHNKYTMADFDEDLREVLKRASYKREKIALIIDETRVFDASFLERINTLLANGEVPGLFEGDEHAALMSHCKESAYKQGLMIDSHDELYKWFTNEVMRNLHVVFTMNPSTEGGLKGKTNTSPALFNRCVLNWFGDWSHEAYYEVAKEYTAQVTTMRLPMELSNRDMLLNVFVNVHQSLDRLNQKLKRKNTTKVIPVTPRHYLDFITQFVRLHVEKREDLEDQQSHLNGGLMKIKETLEQVEELQATLSVKREHLESKNNEANLKLKQMVIDQQEAEKTKLDSQELHKILTVSL